MRNDSGSSHVPPVVGEGEGPPVGQQRRRGRDGEPPVSTCAVIALERWQQQARGWQGSKMWGEAKPPEKEILWSRASLHLPHSGRKCWKEMWSRKRTRVMMILRVTLPLTKACVSTQRPDKSDRKKRDYGREIRHSSYSDPHRQDP